MHIWNFSNSSATFSCIRRFGRLTLIVVGMLLNSIFGLIKSFSFNYFMYIIVSKMMSFPFAPSISPFSHCSWNSWNRLLVPAPMLDPMCLELNGLAQNIVY